MITLLKSILITIFTLLALGTVLFYLFQRQLIFIPDKNRPDFTLAKSFGFKEIILHTKDGLSLNAWYYPATQNHPTIVHFHGNGGNIAGRLYLAKQLVDLGYGLILLDYRGYGGNSGSPSEKGFYQDAEAALSFLQTNQIPQKKWVFFGESIGTGVAVEMATRYRACALVLQSPFKSLPTTARYHHPWLLVPPSDKFDSINKTDAIKTPVLILHGERDTIIPLEHSKALFEKIVSPKKFILYPGGNHNDLWRPDFFTQIDAFLKEHCFHKNESN